VREERTLADGAIELLVELPATGRAAWAAQPGVRLLEPQPLPATAAAAVAEPYLESLPVPLAATLP
jgi:hypothetical protein